MATFNGAAWIRGQIDSILRSLDVLREMGRQISSWVRQGKKVYLLLDDPQSPLFDPQHFIQGTRWSHMNVERVSPTAPWLPEQRNLHRRMREIALSNGAQLIDPIGCAGYAVTALGVPCAKAQKLPSLRYR